MVKAKFEPIGDVVSPETAFIQAANALDVAGALAVKQDSAEVLTQIAALYIELGARLMSPGVEEEETNRSPFGFSSDMSKTMPVEHQELELEDE